MNAARDRERIKPRQAARAARLEIRPIAEAEASRIYPWFIALLPRCVPEFSPEAIEYYRAAWNEARLKDPKTLCFIAWHGAEPKGICLGMPAEGEHPRHWWGMHFWSLGFDL